MFWEARGSAEKPLLHLWSQQFNLTRRVLAITDHSTERLALAVQRFGRAKPDRLEFLRVDFERSARTLSREEFRDHLKRLLAEQFPDETLESLTVAADLEHSLSGNYARGILRRGSMEIAVLAVPDGESADTADNSLTFRLLWLGRARNSSRRGTLSHASPDSAQRHHAQRRPPLCRVRPKASDRALRARFFAGKKSVRASSATSIPGGCPIAIPKLCSIRHGPHTGGGVCAWSCANHSYRPRHATLSGVTGISVQSSGPVKFSGIPQSGDNIKQLGAKKWL
jgi:hypothetical protein